MNALKQRYGFDKGKQVAWADLTPKTMYIFKLHSGRPEVGTMDAFDQSKESVYVVSFFPWLPEESQGQSRVRLWRRDVEAIYEPQDDFAEKLALLNSKTQFDPGVLSEIMKFNKPDFKPGPWTKMIESQRAVTASKGRGRKTRRRKTRRSGLRRK